MKHRKHIAILATLVLVLTLTIPTNVFAANNATLKVNTVKTMTVGTSKKLSIKSNGTISCKTSNKKVISVSGKTLKAKNTGIAKITVTAKKNGCKNMSKKFTVKVVPAKSKITSVETDKNNVAVTAKKLTDVTGYQFKYATNSKLDNATVKKCKSNKLTFTANTEGTYYITVRGYKKSGNTVLYGSWSEKRIVKVIGSEHTHSYTVKITKQPTCDSNGSQKYTCKCGDSYTESITASGHDWKHYESTGHEEKVLVSEAWDENITEVHTFCNQCGQDFGPGNAGADAAGEHTAMDFWDDCENYSSREVTVKTVHHDAVYTTQWVEDTAAYDKCTKCGATK